MSGKDKKVESKVELKRIVMDIPMNLWEKFVSWRERQGCSTDVEGVRCMIREVTREDKSEE